MANFDPLGPYSFSTSITSSVTPNVGLITWSNTYSPDVENVFNISQALFRRMNGMASAIQVPTWEFWANQFLKQLGVTPSQTTMVSILAWMQGEGTLAKNNPLATTLPWPHSTNYNTTLVKNYMTFADGMGATVSTINEQPYAGILTELHKADPRAHHIANAIIASPWGTKTVDVTSVQANYETVAKQPLKNVL